MKIGIQTWGSDGDIFPFISLAAGLRSKGYQVELVVSSIDGKNYDRFSQMFDFKLVQTSNRDLKETGASAFMEIMHRVNNPLKQMDFIFKRLFDPLVDEMFTNAEYLCKNNELIIGHFLHHPLLAAADKHQRPHITVALVHSGVSSRYTPPSGLPNLGKHLNQFFWKMGDLLLHKYFTPPINKLRKGIGIKPIKSYRDAWCSKLLNIIAVSSVFCKKYPDWEPWHRVSGFLNPPMDNKNQALPDDFRRFLLAGPPPVYISFGSMLSPLLDAGYINQTTHILADAVQKAGCRAVLQSDWDRISDMAENPDIFRTKGVPHELAFPHCSLVVHHGGAGITHSATRAGVPSVVVAHMADQLFWGNELKSLGIAPSPLKIKKANAQKIALAIKSVLNNPEMKEKARELSLQMKGEKGIEQAVSEIQKFILR